MMIKEKLAKKSLRFKDKLLYAQGSMGLNILNMTVVTWIVFFYAPPEGAGRELLVPVGLVGLLLFIGRIGDAISDPLVGFWSDNVRTKRGRRIPFILYGAPVLIITFFLLWCPPSQKASTINALYLFLMVNLYFLMFTIVGVPMDAALPDIATTSEERISTSMWKMIFGTIGAIFAGVVTGLLIEWLGYKSMAVLLGVLTFVSLYLTILAITEKKRSEEDLRTQLNIIDALKATFSNRQFLFFAVAMVSFQMGLQMLMIAAPYFVKVTMGMSEAAVGIFLGTLLGPLLLSSPIWLRVGNRWGKRKGNLLALLLMVFIFPFYFFIGYLPGIPKMVQGLAFFVVAAIPIAGLYVFYNALVADIVDYDELKTHKRREAMYWGITGFLIKASYGLASLLIGILFSVFGNCVDRPLGIRLVGPVLGLISIIGFLTFRKYKLPDKVQEKTLAEIEERR